MNPEEFLDLVSRMRQRQRDYFRSRNGEILRECKELEMQVDAAIRDYNRPPDLFDQGAHHEQG